MKEKWTKLGKSLICLALVTSMLAGCGGGGNSSSSSGEQTSGGTSGEVAAGDDNFNETGLPIVKEPVELTFLYVKGANTMDFKDNAMFQQMERTPTSRSTGSTQAMRTGLSRSRSCWPAAICPTYSSETML